MISVEWILKKKRILYYHHLLNCEDSSISKQILLSQIKKPQVGDWIKTLEKDLRDLKVNQNRDQIAAHSKEAFKRLIRESCKEAFFEHLKLKKEKINKGKEINYPTLETQKYLQGEHKVSRELQRKIMQISIRGKYIKANFPMSFSDKLCSASDFCTSHET